MNVSNRNAFFAEVFTRELNRWKQEQHKNQEDFAEEIQVVPNMISRYKKGDAYPADSTMEEICRVLQVEKSIFYPQSFEDRMKYDEETQKRVKLILQEMELESITDSGINFLFWEFLWQAVPNIKRLLPSSIHEAQNGFLFQKKIHDEVESFVQSDLDFIADLQKNVVNYIYMQTIQYALGQQLKKGRSQAAREKRVPEEQELDHHWDSVFSMMLQQLLLSPEKEDTDGID